VELIGRYGQISRQSWLHSDSARQVFLWSACEVSLGGGPFQCVDDSFVRHDWLERIPCFGDALIKDCETSQRRSDAVRNISRAAARTPFHR